VAEPINFNQARKARAKAEAKTQAARDRVAFGRTKAEKTLSKLTAEKVKRALDQVRRED
jgi:Domain of unknown function (DUF4169)